MSEWCVPFCASAARLCHCNLMCCVTSLSRFMGPCAHFCVCVYVCIHSLCLSPLPSYRAPDELIRAVTGVAHLYCLYLAGVSVECCQIVVAHVLSCSLSVLLVPESSFRLLAVLDFLEGEDWSEYYFCLCWRLFTAGYLLLFCGCVVELSNKDLFFTRNWILSFCIMTHFWLAKYSV